MGRRLTTLFCCAALLVAVWGCGKSDDDAQQSADQPKSGQSAAGVASDIPPVAAIRAPSQPSDSRAVPAEAMQESLDAQLIEITKLIAANEALASEEAAQTASESIQEPASPDRTDRGEVYRQRLMRIVELATEVISATHEHSSLEQYFNNAVHYLADARYELALTGDALQAQLLVEDAESLYARDAGSFAAAEAGFKVVELAQRMAESLGPDDAEWFTGYANQVLKYSKRFPDQGGRAALSLFAAGRMCDRAGLPDAALHCFRVLEEQHADSVFAEQSAGFLRRLTLAGQPLELAGPTIDGGFVEIDQYAGRAVLIVFWTSTSEEFREQLPVLQQLEAQYGRRGLAILGVNLDTDEAAVDRFLTTHKVVWPQVFSSDPNQRGGRNPVARYYSVQTVPTYWLVDPSGTVVSAPLGVADLPAEIQKLFKSL